MSATPPDSDNQLMTAYAVGDAHAFEQLYSRHHAALYRFVRRLIGRVLPGEVDEVFQEAWLRVVHARARWQPEGASFRTWLFTLAHHAAIDRLRKSGRETSYDDDEGAPFEPRTVAWQGWPAPGTADGQETRLFWRRAGERLLACLEELPVEQRTVFLLHHEENCTLDELADSLQVGFETTKSRLRYAMSKLRTCMGAYLPAGKAA